MKKNMLISLLVVSGLQAAGDIGFGYGISMTYQEASKYEDLQYKTYTQDRVLLNAAYAGDLAGVEKALKNGANVYVIDEYGNTPYVLAKLGNHLEVMKYIELQQNALSSKETKEKQLTAEKDYDVIMGQLGRLNYEVIQSKRYFQDRVLLNAAYVGDLAGAEKSLKSGANAYALDAYGNTPYFLAKLGNHSEVMKCIESWQKKLSLTEVEEQNLAAEDNYDFIMAKIGLLNYKGIQSKRYPQDRALLDAADKGDLAAVESALKSGANVYAFDAYENTPYFLAKLGNHSEVMKCIESWQKELSPTKKTELELKAQENYRSIMARCQQPQYGDIVNAAYNNNLSEVKKLIRKKVDVNATDINGNTALINAAYHGYTEIVQALINAPKINLEMANKGGSTALVQAARENHLDIVNALIKAGASLTVKKGWTPLNAAQFNGNNLIVKALQKAEKNRQTR